MSNYGKSASAYESMSDRANWEIRFHRAQMIKDYTLIRELLQEGLEEGYDDLPGTSDPAVRLIFQQLTQKSK